LREAAPLFECRPSLIAAAQPLVRRQLAEIAVPRQLFAKIVGADCPLVPRRHLAVSVLAATGNLVVSGPTARRSSDQLVTHLADLCRRLQRWKVVHVICDNASFHKSRAVRRWVRRRGGRVVLHYLPSRAPEENPVERVFWRLHEAVTRNHRFRTIGEWVTAAVEWLEREGTTAPLVEDYCMAA
jgi:transposase